MKYLITFVVLSFSLFSLSQEIRPEKLLEKSISYHDPNGNWPSFKGQLKVVMTTPNKSDRVSDISIDLPKEYFSVTAKRDSTTTTYILDKGICSMALNNKKLDSLSASENKMSCDRANLYKNYYTYLYGLPMKLKDPGTNLNDKVELKTFKGKDYLVLKVTYDEAVGSDVWYFYFNPKTYAMEVYQFFKTDENGKEKPDSGEYIVLSEEAMINDIKMPKVRAWYYNKDNKYLGTDTLIEN